MSIQPKKKSTCLSVWRDKRVKKGCFTFNDYKMVGPTSIKMMHCWLLYAWSLLNDAELSGATPYMEMYSIPLNIYINIHESYDASNQMIISKIEAIRWCQQVIFYLCPHSHITASLIYLYLSHLLLKVLSLLPFACFLTWEFAVKGNPFPWIFSDSPRPRAPHHPPPRPAVRVQPTSPQLTWPEPRQADILRVCGPNGVAPIVFPPRNLWLGLKKLSIRQTPANEQAYERERLT